MKLKEMKNFVNELPKEYNNCRIYIKAYESIYDELRPVDNILVVNRPRPNAKAQGRGL